MSCGEGDWGGRVGNALGVDVGVGRCHGWVGGLLGGCGLLAGMLDSWLAGQHFALVAGGLLMTGCVML